MDDGLVRQWLDVQSLLGRTRPNFQVNEEDGNPDDGPQNDDVPPRDCTVLDDPLQPSLLAPHYNQMKTFLLEFNY